ncbi:hypothetical protein [Streptomyces sp. NPDC020917]|uniref:hypothetical protein n=1 Tax=Streptomyces sp. NPDC020917 TaxID=3365102 RepID=UPI0037A2715A
MTLLTASLIGLSSTDAGAATPTNHCGSSYAFRQSWSITDSWSAGQLTTGFIDVYYNSSNGYNCLTVRANSNVTGVNHLIAGIRKSGASSYTIDGLNSNYTQYAGPVYAYAPGSCIDIYGELSYKAVSGYAGHGVSVYENVHCG